MRVRLYLRRWLRRVPTALITLAMVALAPPQKPHAGSHYPFDPVRAEIRQLMAEQNVPSLAIAVARDGKIIWEEGFGWADRGAHIPATEHTMYSLASISKPVTSTAIMLLKERGRLDLDKPINDYLGDAKLIARAGHAAGATVRRVANHTSGLPLHFQFFYEDMPHRPPPMEETIRRYGNLVTPPGEYFQYSNLGYGVLDHVIARVSGKSYPDFMREDVFLPLGLTRMSAGIYRGLEPYQARRYSSVNGQLLPYYDFDHRGGSDVYASAHDLVRFGMFHMKAHLADQKPILSDAAIEEMQKPTVTGYGMGGYGVGWFLNDRFNYPAVTHGGGMPGVSTQLWLFPQQKIAIVVLTNTATRGLDGIVARTLAAMLPNVTLPPPSQPRAEAPFHPPAELAGIWRGTLYTFKHNIAFTLKIESSGEVKAQLGEQPWATVHLARFRGGRFSGYFSGDIGIEDASLQRHDVQLLLKLRDTGVLNGSASTLSIRNWRGNNALTYWTELRKQPPEA